MVDTNIEIVWCLCTAQSIQMLLALSPLIQMLLDVALSPLIQMLLDVALSPLIHMLLESIQMLLQQLWCLCTAVSSFCHEPGHLYVTYCRSIRKPCII